MLDNYRILAIYLILELWVIQLEETVTIFFKDWLPTNSFFPDRVSIIGLANRWKGIQPRKAERGRAEGSIV